MKRLFIALLLAGMMVVPFAVMAQDDTGAGETAKPKPSAPVLQDMTLSGTISKEEKEVDGKPKATYTLTDAAGIKIKLPSLKKDQTINLDDFVNAKVTVVGQGTEKESSSGKKSISLKTITSIQKVEGAAGAVAPVPAP